MNISKTYRIATNRLIVRCYEPSDADKLLEAITISLNHLRPWMPWAKDEPKSFDSKVELLRKLRGQFDLGKDYNFGIFDKTENELIGSIGLHTRNSQSVREIGYWINAKYSNNGFASEAVGALVKVGFEIEQLSRIEIHCDPRNIKSKKVPERLGFQLEATLRSRIHDVDGNTRDVMIWTMFKEEYQKSAIQEINLKAYDIINREIKFNN